MKRQSGFTLIELLLVLAIIGIISAIAIPALLGQRARAKAKAVGSMVANIAGECARVNDTLKEAGGTVTATTVVGSVLGLSNYNYPATKNPYGGTLTPYTSTASTVIGYVSLTPNDSYVDTATSKSYAAVVIQGYYIDPNTNSSGSTSKVVALD